MRASTAALCSRLAIATALLFPGAAEAQSFLGNGSVVKGDAHINQATPGSTHITVNSSQAVINWSATGPIANGVQTFQDAGTQAIFQNGRVGDYAVLNRILPGGDGSARVSLNGLINSYIGQNTGGTVYFYSPNGIVIGSTARIDVGRLGLTTSDPWDGSSESWLHGNQVNFRQAVAGSSVQVAAGARIRALTEGSYVAMVAPVIGHAGSLEVNGQAALVAAEASTITFNPNGLFDIQVTVGSGGAGTKLSSSGSITGPASSGAGDNHRIYMVAVPKNDAISMALSGGTLGFDVAGKAEVAGNAIVLSAGHGVTAGDPNPDPAKVANAAASISIAPAEVTSALYARARDAIRLGVSKASSRYHSDVGLAARNLVEIGAEDGGTLQIDGHLAASADRRGDGDVTAGTIRLQARDGGTVIIGKSVSLTANAYGGDGSNEAQGAGDATGGTIELLSSGGGSIDVAGDLALSANGHGGSVGGPGGTAGSGIGGLATVVAAQNGSLAVGGDLSVSATGRGGDAWHGTGGDGRGTLAVIEALNGGRVQVGGNATADASGFGGGGQTAGLGQGGGQFDEDGYGIADGAHLFSKGGTLTVNGTGSALANGTGGNGSDGRGGQGGDGAGGWATVTAANSDFGPSRISLSSAVVRANGSGGAGGAGYNGYLLGTNVDGGDGGDGYGGRIAILASAGNGSIEVGTAALEALGLAGNGGLGGSSFNEGVLADLGNGGDGGFADGGFIEFGVQSGSTEASGSAAGRARFGSVTADASATGGAGGDTLAGALAADGGAGGAANSGASTVLVRGGKVEIGTGATMLANATGGQGGSGSGSGTAGRGGDATLSAEGAIGVLVIERFSVGTRGQLSGGIISGQATATAGTGGTSTSLGGSGLVVRNSDVDLAGLSIKVAAAELEETAAADTITLTNGTASIGSLTLTTTGDASLFVDKGRLDAGTLTLSAANFVPHAGATSVEAGLVRAQSASIATGQDFTTNANMEVADDFTLVAPGSITIGDLTGLGALDLTAAGGFIRLGEVRANRGLTLTATGDVDTQDVSSGRGVSLASSDGRISTGDITARMQIRVDAKGNVLVGDVTSATQGVTLLSASGGIDGGEIDSDDRVVVAAAGAIRLLDVTTAGDSFEVGYDINLMSGTSIETGGNIILLADGDVDTGAISTGPSGNLLIGGESMAAAGGPIATFDGGAVLASPLVATGGSVTLGGPVNGRLLQVHAGENVTLGDVAADQLILHAGQLASLTGQIEAGTTRVTSADIDIGTKAVVRGDYAEFISRNATATLIGDGLTGSGYALSDAELDRVQTRDGWGIRVDTGLGAAPIMRVGTLSVTAQPGSTEREFEFAIGEDQNDLPTGTIRVEGDVSFAGLDGGEDEVNFSSSLFQLNAATGSVSLSGTGGELAGYLDIVADRVHVADAAILDKLAANPSYDGREADLNQPAAVQRPQGVLRASEITVWGARQVLVQNTGTAATPAGILAASGDIIAHGDEGSAAGGPIELIINGQIAGEGGTVTGDAVRNAVVTDPDFTPELFAENSSINGCLLNAASCAPEPELPRPEPPRLDTEPPLPDKLFIQTGSGCAGIPADVLVAECDLESDQLIEEPVAGSGNPALAGDTEGNP